MFLLLSLEFQVAELVVSDDCSRPGGKVGKRGMCGLLYVIKASLNRDKMYDELPIKVINSLKKVAFNSLLAVKQPCSF